MDTSQREEDLADVSARFAELVAQQVVVTTMGGSKGCGDSHRRRPQSLRNQGCTQHHSLDMLSLRRQLLESQQLQIAIKRLWDMIHQLRPCDPRAVAQRQASADKAQEGVVRSAEQAPAGITDSAADTESGLIQSVKCSPEAVVSCLSDPVLVEVLESPALLVARQYKWYYARLYNTVVLDGNLEDLRALADVEWAMESGGSQGLTFEQFFRAMFNFVDIWCPETCENEYLQFIEDTCWRALTAYHPYACGVTEDLLDRLFDDDDLRPTSNPFPEHHKWLDDVAQVFARSNARLPGLLKKQISPERIYLNECARLDSTPSTAVLRSLPINRGYTMTQLNVDPDPSLKDIEPLVDILRLNPKIKSLSIRGAPLSSRSVAILADVLSFHPSIQHVNLSGCDPVSEIAAQALFRMVCRNVQITTIRVEGLLTVEQARRVGHRGEMNFHRHAISLPAYEGFKSIFMAMDWNGDGTIDFGELMQYFMRNTISFKVPLHPWVLGCLTAYIGRWPI